MKWKCTDFKCVWKPTKNRLTAISINISTATLVKRKIYSASMGLFKWILGRLGGVTEKVKAHRLTAYLFAWCVRDQIQFVPACMVNTHTQTDSFRSVLLLAQLASCAKSATCHSFSQPDVLHNRRRQADLVLNVSDELAVQFLGNLHRWIECLHHWALYRINQIASWSKNVAKYCKNSTHTAWRHQGTGWHLRLQGVTHD